MNPDLPKPRARMETVTEWVRSPSAGRGLGSILSSNMKTLSTRANKRSPLDMLWLRLCRVDRRMKRLLALTLEAPKNREHVILWNELREICRGTALEDVAIDGTAAGGELKRWKRRSAVRSGQSYQIYVHFRREGLATLDVTDRRRRDAGETQPCRGLCVQRLRLRGFACTLLASSLRGRVRTPKQGRPRRER